MKPLRLRTRLTLWYSCVLAAVLALFAVTVSWQQARIGMRRVDTELDRLSGTAAGLLADELAEGDAPNLAATEVVAALSAAGRMVSVVGADGHVIAASPGQPAVTQALDLASHRDAAAALTTADGRWRVALRTVSLHGQSYRLAAFAPTADADRERTETQEAMWLGMPFLVLFAATGGYWLATRALRPITDMAERAASLPVDGSDDLGRSGSEDELGVLERSFNGLVARLRASLHTQRQFMADASHELRTPVSVMRAAADVTLDRDHRNEPEYREALGLIAAQTQHVGRVLDDMLMLARADAGGYPLAARLLYVDELVTDCRAALANSAREHQITIDVVSEEDVALWGDEDLLRRLVLNLLQNAVQHSRAGGRVCVHVERDVGAVRVSVTDEGPGIPEADRERIFDRFVQLDASRRRAGAGLGLPISRWIAQAHGGRLDLAASSATGSRFVATLPAGETASPMSASNG